MKAEYDKETDTLTITLRDARVKESDEIRPGVIADFGYDGGVVGFEILQASKVVEKAGEWSREDASDIDGQGRKVEWSFWESDIEGKTARVAASELGKERVSNGREHMSQFQSSFVGVFPRRQIGEQAPGLSTSHQEELGLNCLREHGKRNHRSG